MKKFSLNNGKKRFAMIGLMIFIGFGAVFLRLIWLQVIQSEELGKRANNRSRARLPSIRPAALF